MHRVVLVAADPDQMRFQVAVGDVLAPALTVVVVEAVDDNNALTSLSLPALTLVGGQLWVKDNDALAQCLVDALVEQIEAGEGIWGATYTTSNNTDCTCQEVAGVLEATCP